MKHASPAAGARQAKVDHACLMFALGSATAVIALEIVTHRTGGSAIRALLGL